MLTFQLYGMRAVRPTSMKRLLIVGIGVVVAVTGMAVTSHQPGRMMPDAKAGEAVPALVGKTADSQQESWSDEWHEVHKALSDSVIESIQAF